MKYNIDDSLNDYPEFKQFFGQLLELIDKDFVDASQTIYKRPFLAVREIIMSDLIESQNITKEEFLDPPWFYYWYIRVRKWYIEKYGEDAFNHKTDTNFKSFVLIENIPYSFQVPIAINRKGKTENLYVLKFPNHVLVDEIPFEWIQSAPAKEYFSQEKFDKISQEINNRANLIRNIFTHTRFIKTDDEEMNILLQNITMHLEWFIDDFLNNRKRSIGVWELSFSVESALKFNHFSNSGKKLSGHKLQDLYTKCLKDLKQADKLIKYLTFNPIAYRYGENTIIENKDINNIYNEVLQIIDWALTTSKSNIRISGDGVEIVIRDPYYH